MVTEESEVRRIVEVVLKLTSETDRSQRQFEQSGRRLDNQLKQTRDTTRELDTSTKSLGRSLTQTGQAATRAGRSADQAADGFEELDEETENVAESIGKAQRGLNDFIRTIAGAAGFSLAVNSAREFSVEVAEISTLVDTAVISSDELRDSIKDLQDEFGAPRTQAAQGLYQAISSGAEAGAEANELLNVAIRTAIGGVTDIESAVDGLTTVINAFNLGFDEAETVADQLFTTVRIGRTTIGELSQFLFQAAPLASALGVSFEELQAALVGLSLGGVPTRTAFTQINTALSALIRPSEQLQEVFQEAGFESSELALRTVGLQGSLDILAEATNGSVLQLQELLGSADATRAVLGLTGNNAENFSEALTEIENSAGALDEAFEKVNDTLGSQFQQTLGALSSLLESLGTAFGPAIEAVLEIIEDLAEALTDVIEAAPAVSAAIAGIVASLTAVAGLGIAIRGLSTAFVALGVSAAGATTSVTGLNIALGILTGTTRAFVAFLNSAAAVPLAALLAGAAASSAALSVALDDVNEELAEIAENTRRASNISDQFRELKEDFEELGIASEEFNRNLTVLQASAIVGNIPVEETLNQLRTFRDRVLQTEQQIERERANLRQLRLRQEQQLQEQLQIEVRRTLQDQLQAEQDRVRQTQESQRRIEQAIRESQQRILDIQRQRVDFQRSAEDQLREIGRRDLEGEQLQANLEAEAAERVLEARDQLARTADEEAQKEAQRNAEAIRGLADRVDNQRKAEALVRAAIELNEEAAENLLNLEDERAEKSREAQQAARQLLAVQRAEVEKTQLALEELGQDVEVNVDVRIDEAERAIDRLIAKLDELRAAAVDISAPAPGFHSGGRVPGYGGGDKVDIRAEGGEFIVRKNRAGAFHGLLSAINSAPLSTVRGMIQDMAKPRFQDGGVVSALPTTSIGNLIAGVDATRAAAGANAERMALDLTFNGNDIGTMFGDRDTVDRLVTALGSAQRGRISF